MSKQSSLALPEFDVNKSLPLRIVTKAVSVTFLILLVVAFIGGIIIFTVDMDATISSDGLLEASNVSRLHSPESGIINKVFVASGDTVEADQKIAELDSTDLKERLIQLESELSLTQNNYSKSKENVLYSKRERDIALTKANAQLLRAKASFRDRILDFFPDADPDSVLDNYKPGTHINLDYAMAEVHSAEAEIKNQELQIEMLSLKEYELRELEISIDKLRKEMRIVQSKLDNLVIKSPIKGIILTEGIDRLVGNYFNKGELLIEISDITKWNVTLFVNEADVHNIDIGDRVKIEVNALKSEKDFDLLSGLVTSVSAEQINDQDDIYRAYAGRYRVSAKIEGMRNGYLTEDLFKHGYTVKANIITKSGKIVELLLDYLRENL